MAQLLEAKLVGRRYAAQPHFVHRRHYWEFLVVLDGAIRPLLPPPEPPEPVRQQCCWLFTPDHAHGWTADRDPCRILVLAWDDCPASLQGLIDRDGWIAWSYQPADCALLAERASALLEASGDRELRAEHLLWTFARLTLDRPAVARGGGSGTSAASRVARALAWFADHLPEAPDLADVARVAGCSPTHLRRLIRQVEGGSARARLDHIRMTRADRLLITTDAPITAVAQACGYRSTSAFCRAYREHRGRSPGQQRGRIRITD